MAANAPPSLAPPAIFYSTQAIILHVGPSEQPMLLHEDCAKSSEYLTAATEESLPVGQSRLVKLPDEHPKVMAHYLAFLYGANLPTHVYDTTNPGGLKSDGYELLAHLYVLREHLLDSAFRNAIIDEFMRLSTLQTVSDATCATERAHYPTTAPVNITYRGTCPESPVRRLLVDMNLRFGGEHWHTIDLEPAFLFDFMQAYFSMAKTLGQKLNKLRQAELKAANYYV